MKRYGLMFVLIAMLVLVFAMPVAAETEPSAIYFKDVPQNKWYTSYVYSVANEGLMVGCGNDEFCPDRDITRAEIVMMLARLSGENYEVYQNREIFSDCKTHWSKSAINWAATKGVVNGIGGNKFAPNDPITREQLCTMMLNFAKYENYYPKKTVSPIAFTDNDQISSWAKESVYHMQRAGVIAGRGNGKFDPKGHATRAECAKVFHCYKHKTQDDYMAKESVYDYKIIADQYPSYDYYIADFTHDGYDDLFVVVPGEYDARLHVFTSLGGNLDEIMAIETYNVAWKEYFYIYQDYNGAHLLYYDNDAATGMRTQTVALFYGTNTFNQVMYLKNNTVEFYFDGSPLDTGIPQAYYDDMNFFNRYQAKSTFLFGCDDQTMVYDHQTYQEAMEKWGF